MGLPTVNADGSPASQAEAASHWVFRCRTHDPRQHDFLVDYLIQQGRKRFALIQTPDATSDEHLSLFAARIRRRQPQATIVLEFQHDPEAVPVSFLVDAIARSKPDVVIMWTGASRSAETVAAMRRAGIDAVFVGSDHIVCDDFIVRVGRNPGDIIAPQPCPHRRDASDERRFIETYVRQNASHAAAPPAEAFRSYDAARHLMLAINIAGPDRTSVRTILAALARPRVAELQDGAWWYHD